MLNVLDGAAGVTNSVDFSSFITALTGTITPAQILTVLASCVGIGIVFVLMWMGVRKIVGSFSAAVMRGKLKI